VFDFTGNVVEAVRARRQIILTKASAAIMSVVNGNSDISHRGDALRTRRAEFEMINLCELGVSVVNRNSVTLL